MRILIDNGHGINTSGKRSPIWEDGSRLLEWRWTREVASRLEEELNYIKIPVNLIVPECTDVPLWERCSRVNRIASQFGAKNCLLISIHVNASQDGKAKGWEIHTYRGQSIADAYSTIFWKVAEKGLLGITKMRGDFTDSDPDIDSNFAILRNTICPAVLTENLFMDNYDDCKYLLSEEGKENIVAIHLNAIKEIVNQN